MNDSDSEDDGVGISLDQCVVSIACKNLLLLETEIEQMRNILDFVAHCVPQKVLSEINRAELMVVIRYCVNYNSESVSEEVSRRSDALNSNDLSNEDYEFIKKKVLLEHEYSILKERIEKLRLTIMNLNESNDVKMYLKNALKIVEDFYRLKDDIYRLEVRLNQLKILKIDTNNVADKLNGIELQQVALSSDKEVHFDLESHEDFPPLK